MTTRALAKREGRGLYPRPAGAQQLSGVKRRTLPEYLEKEEVEALIKAAPHPQARLLICLQWRAGLRVSEALAVEPRDLSLDGDRPTVRVRQGKGGRPRVVPVHPELRAALVTALGYARKRKGPVVQATRQERLISNKEYARRRAKHDYPLRGLVFCGNCGRRMVGASPGRCRSYRCTGHKWNPEHHCGHSVNADSLETGVWEKVLDILSHPELIRAEVEQRRGDSLRPELEAQLGKVQAKLRSLSQGEAAIARQLRQGLLSEDVAARELRQGQQERAALERERANLLGQLEAAQHWEALDIEALCQQARANLEAPTAEIKRLAFEALQVKVTVRRQEAIISLALPVQEKPEDSFALRTPREGGQGDRLLNNL